MEEQIDKNEDSMRLNVDELKVGRMACFAFFAVEIHLKVEIKSFFFLS